MIERVKSAMVGLGAGWVLVLMLVLSVASLAIMLERAWLYWSLRDDVPSLMRDLGRLLRAGDLEGARKRLEASPSAEAAVVIAGIVEAGMGSESAEEAMLGASALQKLKLEKRLTFLGTLGNNAPFIGLFGTVLGIIKAFADLAVAQKGGAAAAGGTAAASVMSGISEALVATAVGLFVAIPAVLAYNIFLRLLKRVIGRSNSLLNAIAAGQHVSRSVAARGANGGK